MTTRDSTNKLLDNARRKRAPPVAPRGRPRPRGGPRGRVRRGSRRGTGGRGRGGVGRGGGTQQPAAGGQRNSIRQRGTRRGSVRRPVRGRRGGNVRRPAFAPPRSGPPTETVEKKKVIEKVEEKSPPPQEKQSSMNKIPPKNRTKGPERPSRPRGRGKPIRPSRGRGRPAARKRINSPTTASRASMFEKSTTSVEEKKQPAPGRPLRAKTTVSQAKERFNKPQPQQRLEEEILEEENLDEEVLDEESLDTIPPQTSKPDIIQSQPYQKQPQQHHQQHQPQQNHQQHAHQHHQQHAQQHHQQPQQQRKVQPQPVQVIQQQPVQQMSMNQMLGQQHQQHQQQQEQEHRQQQPQQQQVIQQKKNDVEEEVEGEDESSKNSASSASAARPSSNVSSGNGGGDGEKKKPIFTRRKEEQVFTDELKESFFIFDLNGDGTIEKSLIYEMLEESQHDLHEEIVREVEQAPKIDFPFYESFMKKYFAMPYSEEELRGMLNELEPVNGNFEFEDFKRALEEANGGNLEDEMKEILDGLKSGDKLSVDNMVKEMGSRL